MAAPDSRRVDIVSRGKLVQGVSMAQAVQQLGRQFKLNQQQAARLLEAGVVLKRNVEANKAKAYCQNFLRMGLVTGISSNKPQKELSQQATAAAKPKPRQVSKQDRSAAASIDRAFFERIFQADIPRASTKAGYKIGLLSVAILNLLAPSIYVGIILSLLFGLFQYAMHLPQWLSQVSGGTIKLLIISVPPFAITVLVLFLLKPLFTRIPHWRGIELQRQQAPLVFDLVEIMCQRMGVPIPAGIYVDNQVNASAGSAGGLLALLKGRVILTIGLPLVSGMNARQLAGVLAHEFGHFAQPSAMFAYYLIKTVNAWFADRAFQDDPWDQRLEKWEDNTNNIGFAFVAIKFTQFGIQLTRFILKALFLFNLRITNYMSRQMEYDADRYEALVAGSDQFRANSLHLRILSYAEHVVEQINQQAWNQNKLIKNIPDAIAVQSMEFDKNIKQDIASGMSEETTDTWASHPADNDRAIHAENFDYPGLFQAEFAATKFFLNFSSLCNQITLYDYQEAGIENSQQLVVDNKHVLDIKEAQDEAEKTLSRYFNNSFSSRLMYLEKTTNSTLSRLDLQASINWLRSQLVEYNNTQKTHETIQKRFNRMSLGQIYLEKGIKVNPADFYLNGSSPQQITQVKTNEQTKANQCKMQLDQVDNMFFQRILLAIKSMKKENQQLSIRLLKTLQIISRLTDYRNRLAHHVYLLSSLLNNKDELLSQVQTAINQNFKFCATELKAILQSTSKIPDLIEPVKKSSAKDFIILWTGKLPDDLNRLTPVAMILSCNKALDAINYQYSWLFGELVTLCENQEKSLGVQPIKLLNFNNDKQ